MTILEIEGRKVEVDDSFKAMSPEEQHGVVDEIAASMPPKQSGGVMDAASDFARQHFEGFNQGIGNLIAAPADLTNLASRGINAVTNAVVGEEYLGEIPDPRKATSVGRFLAEDTEPRGMAGRVGQSVGEFIGGDLPIAAATIAAAPAAAGINLARGAGALRQGIKSAGQAITNSPGKAAVGELIAATGAGVGGQISEEVSPNSPITRTVSELTGALTPAGIAKVGGKMPAALAAKAYKAAIKRFSSEEMAKRAREDVTSALSEELTTKRLDELKGNLDLQASIPGTNFTLGELVDTPSLKRSQDIIGENFSGARLDEEIARREGNASAIDAERERSTPKGSHDPDIIVEDVATRVSRVRQTAERGSKVLDLRERKLAESLPSGDKARTQGSALRDELIDRRRETKAEMRRIAEDSGLNDPNAQVNFSGMRKGLLDAIPKPSDFTDKAALPNVLKSIEGANDVQPFSALMELRSRITDDISDALRGIPKRKTVANLEAVKRQLDESIDAAVANTLDPDLAKRYRSFLDTYRKDLIEPFETGASYRVLQKDGTRAYKVRDELVAREFFSDGNEQAALSFKKVFGTSEQANDTMAAAAFDSLSDFAVRDGVILPTAIKAWVRKHKTILDEFPAIKSQVQNIQDATLAIGERKAVFRERAKEIENNVLTKEIKKIDTVNKEPATLIADAITQPGRMRRLLSAVRSQAGKNAVARISFDNVLDAPNPIMFLNKNEVSLKQALGGAGFNNLKRIIRATTIANRVRNPAGAITDLGAGPLQDVESALGTGLNQLSSRVFAVQSGRTSSRYVAFDIMGRAFRKFSSDQTRKVLEEAIFNPKLGRELAQYASAKSAVAKAAAAKRLHTYLIGIGLGPDEAGDE